MKLLFLWYYYDFDTNFRIFSVKYVKFETIQLINRSRNQPTINFENTFASFLRTFLSVSGLLKYAKKKHCVL